jgi:hypothetical protein
MPSELGIFEQEKEFGTKGCSRDGGSDYGPADWCGERIAEAAAKCEVDAEGDEVGESLEEGVRVNAVGAEAYVDGEVCEMGREGDGEL